MRTAAFRLVAVALALSPAVAQAKADGQAPSARECLAKTSHPDERLSPTAKQTRDRLIRDPNQIGAIVRSAGAANQNGRTQIELGIVRAVEYLKCVDPTGYEAVVAFLKDHSEDPVVAEIDNALGSLASAGGGGGGGGADGGGGGGGAGGGFSGGGGPQISTH